MKKIKANKRLVFFSIFIVFIFYFFWPRNNVPMPTELHPVLVKNMDKLIKRSEEQGISILITQGLRTVKDQNNLYAQGRTKPGNVVTYVKGGSSFHNYGLAIDFAIQLEDGSVLWDLEFDGNNNGRADWYEVVDIAKELGFEWGGDWKNFKDYPHLQMDFGLSIRDLKRGERPEIPEE